MNILLLCHYAGSPYYGMAYRPYYMAREWVKMGHKVTIVGASYSHNRINQPIVKDDLSEEIIDGVKYIWFKTPEYRNSLKRIMNIISFVYKLYRYGELISKKELPDLVIASSTVPLENFPAKRIADLSRAKFCYEVHDLWPLSPMTIGGYSKYHPFIMAVQAAENFGCKHSDILVSLLWNSEQHFIEHGLKPNRFKCIPNGFLEDDWTDDIINMKLPEEHERAFVNLGDKLIVGFAGGFAPSGALTYFLYAANELKLNEQIQFVLVGKGKEEAKLRKIIDNNQLKNVTILPPVMKKFVPSVIRHFDIAYYGGHHTILHQYGTCANKMTDYMLSSKPIVQAIDEPGSLVERIGCGIRVEAENYRQIAKAITSLADMTQEERTAMGRIGHDYVRENLEWRKLAKDFVDLFED